MARNYKDKQSPGFDYTQLQSVLVNSGLQKENPALYKAINRLIFAANDFQSELANSVKKTDFIDLQKQVTGSLLPVNGGSISAFYTPPITNISNVTSSQAYQSLILISQGMIQASGKLNIKASAAATLTELEIELPLHSKFDSSDQLQGLLNGIPLDGSTEGFSGIITGNISNGQAHVSYYPRNTDNHDIRFMLSYQLL